MNSRMVKNWMKTKTFRDTSIMLKSRQPSVKRRKRCIQPPEPTLRDKYWFLWCVAEGIFKAVLIILSVLLVFKMVNSNNIERVKTRALTNAATVTVTNYVTITNIAEDVMWLTNKTYTTGGRK